MNYYINKAIEIVKANWKLLAILAGLLLLAALAASVSESCGKPNVEKEKRRIENLANLEQQGAAKGREVEMRRESYEDAKNAADGARNATDGALSNVGRVSNANFANTNLRRAQEARCRAFPEDCR